MDFMTNAFSSGTPTTGTTPAPYSQSVTTVPPPDASAAGMNVTDIISGSASAMGALAQYRASEIEAATTEGQARLASERAKMERVKGLQEANDARERLIRALAQQNAAASVSGVNMNAGGSFERGGEVLVNEGNRQVGTIKSNARVASAVGEAEAIGLRASAKGQRAAGRAGLGMGLLGAFDRVAKRGTVPATTKPNNTNARGGIY